MRGKSTETDWKWGKNRLKLTKNGWNGPEDFARKVGRNNAQWWYWTGTVRTEKLEDEISPIFSLSSPESCYEKCSGHSPNVLRTFRACQGLGFPDLGLSVPICPFPDQFGISRFWAAFADLSFSSFLAWHWMQKQHPPPPFCAAEQIHLQRWHALGPCASLTKTILKEVQSPSFPEIKGGNINPSRIPQSALRESFLQLVRVRGSIHCKERLPDSFFLPPPEELHKVM